MKVECWRCKTGSEEPGPETVELPSQLGTGYVQTVSWQRNKLLPPLSHNYFDFCYNSQNCFLTNNGIHFYTLCANEHLGLKETNNLPKITSRTVFFQAAQIWCFLLEFLSDMEMPVKSHSSFSIPEECPSLMEVCLLELRPGWVGRVHSLLTSILGLQPQQRLS